MTTTPEYPHEKPPSLRKALVCTIIAWLSCVVGVVLAIMRQDWLVAIYALLTALATCCWWLALSRWIMWRGLAFQTLILLEHLGDGR